jgi:hypothetical protein
MEAALWLTDRGWGTARQVAETLAPLVHHVHMRKVVNHLKASGVDVTKLSRRKIYQLLKTNIKL